MTYKPRNRNEPTQDAPKSTARWFDDRRDEGPSNRCGFEPERWAIRKGAN